jgi:cell division protein FtsN
MARDYGSRKSSRRGSNMPQQVLVMVVTFLMGYFTASIFDIEKLSHWMTTQVLENHEPEQKIAQSNTEKPVAPVKAKFEFYTLLANEKGTKTNQAGKASGSSVNQATTVAAAAAATTSNSLRKPTQGPGLQTTPVNVVNAKPVTSTPSSSAKGHFVVQVASFKARQDAEHMKGSLTLKGFEVTVVPVNTPEQGIWFRVLIGPYPNRELAQKAQVILAKTERLNGMVRSAG